MTLNNTSIRKAPTQELYDWFYTQLTAQGWNVHSALPQEDTPDMYPFVVIGQAMQTLGGTKTSLNGSIALDIDVWGSAEQRFTVGGMGDTILRNVIGSIETSSYNFYANPNEQLLTVSSDTSVPNKVYQRCALNLTIQIK